MTAEALVQVNEPLKWKLRLGQRGQTKTVAHTIRKALVGAQSVHDEPAFLEPHQIDAYARVLSTIRVYGGALLCDSVGLGKTFVSLAIARRFERVLVVVPSAIVHQWRSTARKVGITVQVVSHETFSRGSGPKATFDLIVVDEAHRFRNANTKRYRTLSHVIGTADVLLVTATPVVNGPSDLLHLLRLFLPDHGMALHGIPSLENALGHDARSPVLKRVSPLMTARSSNSAGVSESKMPRSLDAPVEVVDPLHHDALQDVLRLIDELEFPAFTHREEACRLLRAHLLYRLHSSVAALMSTLRRHRTYLNRAIEAAHAGSPLSRREIRSVFDMEDRQLDMALLVLEDTHQTIDANRFRDELNRVGQLIDILSASCKQPSPKLERLISYLNTRTEKKTVVFVSAVPTANAIARRLGWSKLVLVTSGRARISSGPLPLVDALRLFAPRANDVATPPASLRTDVLIATDALSEGVNLQDADVIIHYDLPWTSLRLQQRVGRIRRMGTQFRVVTVRWFVPPPAIEQRLGLCNRIAAKLQYQLQLGVPSSSGVGRANVTNEALEKREQIIAAVECRDCGSPSFAVVQGPLVAVYAIKWTLTSGVTRDIILAAGNGEIVNDLGRVCDILNQLFRGTASRAYPSRVLQRQCEEVIRRRLAGALRGPTSHYARQLGRRIVGLARTESAARRLGALDILDGVLQTILAGTPVGAEFQLREMVDRGCSIQELATWKQNNQRKSRSVVDVQVEAVLFGDGSMPEDHSTMSSGSASSS